MNDAPLINLVQGRANMACIDYLSQQTESKKIVIIYCVNKLGSSYGSLEFGKILDSQLLLYYIQVWVNIINPYLIISDHD